MRKFINRIQNSDEKTRRFWLIVFSGAAMILILALWVIYIKATIAEIDQPKQQNEIAQLQPGFTKTFSAGLKNLGAQIKEKFSSQNQLSFENKERNFILDGLEPIPKTPLP